MADTVVPGADEEARRWLALALLRGSAVVVSPHCVRDDQSAIVKGVDGALTIVCGSESARERVLSAWEDVRLDEVDLVARCVAGLN
jgi:hypothetical protein